ncbi:peptidoglycan editing factor PgeF [Chitinimonas viridis]|uniref:Purine nucleoside phosphorylase n=1 Tax=Chitinimonas viridis TaxID=664880 RepID=A0ABT8B314_9NEIS|nr:peptidoglycan editing factor PgeF [Chitinimonas viridis]MDN3576653.1 peptidoglycan editing factor PgeF [Chitinimonas viridis]
MSDWIRHAMTPDWPVPQGVHALVTTRRGGVSLPPYDSFNLGDHVADAPAAVAANRALLRTALPAEPTWLNQVHGTVVVEAGHAATPVPQADASVAFGAGAVCLVMTADCLPVLFAREDGMAVGAAHAGWRGLHDGVLEATIARLGEPARLLAWLGPAIGPDAFEVGDEVRQAFVGHDPAAAMAFRPGVAPGKWWADIYSLARQRLAAAGVSRVYGGGLCTVADAQQFFSYRRDRVTGRMASMIWMAP